MKSTSVAVLLSLFFLSSCVIHVHVQPAAAPQIDSAESSPDLEAPLDLPQAAPQLHTGLPVQGLSGRVLDSEGQPVRAHVSLVSDSGSLGTRSAEDGSFSFRPFSGAVQVLSSNTDTGYAYQEVELGAPIQLILKPPVGTLRFTMNGQPSMRLAIFKEGTRIEDSTVRDGRELRLVLPTGCLHVRLYKDDSQVQTELELEPGETQPLTINVASKGR